MILANAPTQEISLAVSLYIFEDYFGPQCQSDSPVEASHESNHEAQGSELPQSDEQEQAGQLVSFGSVTTTMNPIHISGFEDIWLPMEAITWEADSSEELKVIYLLDDFYKAAADSRMILPFMTHIYSEPYFKMRWIVTGSKFCSGKCIVSVLYSPHGMPAQMNLARLSQSKHVCLYANQDNIVELNIPFEFHRSFVHNFPWSGRVTRRSSTYCKLVLTVVSGLRAGTMGPSRVRITPYIQMASSTFYAPCRRFDIVRTQMMTNISLCCLKRFDNMPC